VVGSVKSNYGVSSSAYHDFINQFPPDPRVTFEFCEPVIGAKMLTNETRKRNYGLDVARYKRYSHFLIADADEMYESDQMLKLKESVFANGFVHKVRAYITPTLYCDDHTLVCGIHRLEKDVFCGNYPYYPFAYDGKGVAHIDPSRRLGFRDGIILSDVFCFHYTLVRKDIDMKINNSTANSLRHNREIIYNEIRYAKPGNLSRLYHTEIKESENYFNIPIWDR
jgi:hypothetical protein